jgi:hypothetical protein
LRIGVLSVLGSARVAKQRLHDGLDRMQQVLGQHEVDVLLPIGGPLPPRKGGAPAPHHEGCGLTSAR